MMRAGSGGRFGRFTDSFRRQTVRTQVIQNSMTYLNVGRFGRLLLSFLSKGKEKKKKERNSGKPSEPSELSDGHRVKLHRLAAPRRTHRRAAAYSGA